MEIPFSIIIPVFVVLVVVLWRFPKADKEAAKDDLMHSRSEAHLFQDHPDDGDSDRHAADFSSHDSASHDNFSD